MGEGAFRCLRALFLSFHLGLIRTIEGEHASYLTQMLACAKLLLFGELPPDLPVCRVRRGFAMHIHERCRLGAGVRWSSRGQFGLGGRCEEDSGEAGST